MSLTDKKKVQARYVIESFFISNNETRKFRTEESNTPVANLLCISEKYVIIKLCPAGNKCGGNIKGNHPFSTVIYLVKYLNMYLY